jgi:Na+:H+ antiporter, NhaA family
LAKHALSRRIADRTLRFIAEFLRIEAASGVLLILAASAGMVCANSDLASEYFALLAAPIGFVVPGLEFSRPVLWWINDGLMALFFLQVGLELKREFVEGQFADRRQIALPLVCALGGMLVPMAIFAALNSADRVALRGFAIPAATDIAFALGVLAVLGRRVPLALKLMLTAIAVFDDIGAIVIIAVFFSGGLTALPAVVALAALLALWLLNRASVANAAPYLAVGLVLWAATYLAGVHPTLAGVALGCAIPSVVPRCKTPEQAQALEYLGLDAPLLRRLEHALHPWVAFGILPLFAFANAGVPLAGMAPADLLAPVPLGIVAGLVVGKQLGIFAAGWGWVRLGLARRPEAVSWAAFYGMAVLCGIGFTMSLFLAALSYGDHGEALMRASRLGVLSGSVVSALLGLAVLAFVLRRRGDA